MPRTNKRCCLCKEDYYYCAHCPAKSPAYMLTFCSANCRDIYKAIAGFLGGDLTKEEAADILSVCDLSGISKFTKGNQKTIADILEGMPKKKVIEETPVTVKVDTEKPKEEVKAPVQANAKPNNGTQNKGNNVPYKK